MSYLYPQLWKGILGSWCPGKRSTGSRLLDYGPFGLHGQFNNMGFADWSHRGIKQNNHDTYVEFGDDDRFSFVDGSGDTPFSISIWTYTTDDNQNGVPLGKGARYAPGTSPNGGTWYREWTIAFSPTFNYSLQLYDSTTGGNTLSRRGGTWENNRWKHLVWCYDGSHSTDGYTVYEDGIDITSSMSVSSVGIYPGMSNTLEPLRTSQQNHETPTNAATFKGYIDDIRIYNRVLLTSEARLLSTARGIAYRKRTRNHLFLIDTPSEDTSGMLCGTAGVRDQLTGRASVRAGLRGTAGARDSLTGRAGISTCH